MNKPWKSQKDSYSSALKYLKQRQLGVVKSIKTPWNKFNDATLDGLEWNTIIVIGARPGTGKTVIADQIVREAHKLNPDQNFRILQFQFEMLGRTQAIREYTSVLSKSYKYLCSAEGTITDEDLDKCYKYSQKKVAGSKVNIIDNPCTVAEFEKLVLEYYKEYKEPVLVTIDHSILFQKAPYEKDLQEMLSNLGKTLTQLKKQIPVLFILLSQLNRNSDNPERAEDGKYSNYILESDVFGSDALLQHADLLIGVNRPAKQKIKYYGPDRYIIDDDKTLVFHFLKVRNGEPRISFFKAEFEKMSITEMITPATQSKRLTI
jgi:replicative DNA helicase